MKKVVVLYRVVQNWRAPIFDKLNKYDDLNLQILHGPDFVGSKLINTTKVWSFKTTLLTSIRLSLKSSNGLILMPLSPFLFFRLVYENPNVVIAEGASNIFNSFQGFVYSKLFRKRFIWWSLGKLQDRNYDNKRKLIDRLIQFIERNSECVLTYSSQGKEYFKSIGIPESKINVAVNVVDTKALIKENLNRDLSSPYEFYHKKYDFVNVFVGALIPEKNIQLLLETQQILNKDTSRKFGLLIVGDGNYRDYLENFVSKKNIDNVEFLGHQSENLYKFLSGSDLFILPGLGGLAISEAMCFKKPVICSIGDGSEKDLVNESNGFILNPITPELLGKTVLELANDKLRLKVISENAFEMVNTIHTSDNYISNIYKAING